MGRAQWKQRIPKKVMHTVSSVSKLLLYSVYSCAVHYQDIHVQSVRTLVKFCKLTAPDKSDTRVH